MTVLEPFWGWAICLNPDQLPENWGTFFQDYGLDDLDWTQRVDAISKTAPNASTARGNSKSNVVRCVFEAYPDGKGTATWQEVVQRVGYSRRHITRSLKAAGLYEKWIS